MNEIVKYHNDLSNEIILKNFTANELNFLMAICSKMKNQETNEFIFDFSQLKELVKWTINDNEYFVKSLANTNKKLIALNLKFEDERQLVPFVLFPTFITDEINKTLTVKVNEEFKFLLNNLTSNFTRFELENFTTLKSKYSKYLYKELMKFKSTGYLIMTIEDFKNKLDIPLKYRMTHINEKVLTPAKEELSKILKKFEIKKIKKGREITHIEFSFVPTTEDNIYNKENIYEYEEFEELKEGKIIIEKDDIKEFFDKNFPNVKYTTKHKKILGLLKDKKGIDSVKNYLKDQWEYVQNNSNIFDKNAYFTTIILDKRNFYDNYTEDKLDETEDLLAEINKKIKTTKLQILKIELGFIEEMEENELEKLEQKLKKLIDGRNFILNEYIGDVME